MVDPEAIKVEYQPSLGNMVARFPAETIALVTGQGISRHWSAFVEQSKNSATSPDKSTNQVEMLLALKPATAK